MKLLIFLLLSTLALIGAEGEDDPKPVITIEPSSQLVGVEGENAVLTCYFTLEHYVPDLFVKGEQGILVPFNDPTRVSRQMGNGSISFTLLDLDAARDSGLEFLCASFRFFSSIVIVMVYDDPEPVVTIEPSSQLVGVEGENALLTCYFTDEDFVPDLFVKGEQGMLVFNDPTRVSMQMGNGLISFTLLDLDAARDSGLEFMCASFHMFSSIVILMVNVPVRYEFVSDNGIIVFVEGTLETINLGLTAVPDPQFFILYFNDEVLSEGNGITFNAGSISFFPTALEHAGKYFLEASNGIGNDSVSFTLAVLCEEGSVRLDGSSPSKGRVLFCTDGELGTICDNGWDDRDARVVCRDLGLIDDANAAVAIQGFGGGTGPIHLEGVSCSGNEYQLKDCAAECDTGSCSHYQDAGVDCMVMVATTMAPPTTEATDPSTEPTPPIPERVLRFVNDTPIVDGTTVMFAIDSTAGSLSCRLSGMAFPCSVGENAVYDLEVGLRYFLRVTAFFFGDENVKLARRIYVPQTNECSVVLINDGITFDGAMLETEFSGTGGATEFECRVDKSEYEPCMSPYMKIITNDDLPNSVRIRPTDCEQNQQQTISNSSFTTMTPPTTGTPTTMVTPTKPTPPAPVRVLRFVNDTPIVDGTTVIFAIDSTAGNLSCRLSGVAVPCSVGENAVYDLEDGVRYVLRVTADDFGDEDVELVRRIYVPQTNECSVVLINDGITFDGAMLEMEFSGTGGATEFECRVENGFEPCTSPYMKNITKDDLPNRVRIRPTDCEVNVRQNFKISSFTTMAPPTTGTPTTIVTLTDHIPIMAPLRTKRGDQSIEPIPERVLRFVNDTPIVDGTTVIFAIDSTAGNLSCMIAGMAFPCSVGENAVYDLEVGLRHVLRVTADDFGDDDVELVRRIYVPQINECSVVLINDGITFDGAILEMEFSQIGGATEFECRVNDSNYEPCTSPYTKTIIKDNLPNYVRIRPTGCEENVVQKFNILSCPTMAPPTTATPTTMVTSTEPITTMAPPTTGTPTTMVTSTEPIPTMAPLTTEPSDPSTEPTLPTPKRVLRFVNDTPIVDGTTVMFAIDSTAGSLSCRIAGAAFPCSVGENAVCDLEVGLRYVLRVTADDFGDEDVELVRRIYVPQINECSVVLINDGITFDGAILEMEFSGIGGATEFECRVNKSDYEPCTSSYMKTITKDDLPISVTIRPTDCEENVVLNSIFPTMAPPTTESTDPPTEPTPPDPERVLRFVNDTPIVDGTTVIFAIDSTACSLSCRIAGKTFPCSVGENAVDDLEVGLRHVLRVTADDFGDDDVELVRRIYVPQINECSVVLINDGITFDGVMLEMEFSGTGGATEFECRVESGFEPCTSPYMKIITKDNLPNSVSIVPTDCEESVRQNFTISSFTTMTPPTTATPATMVNSTEPSTTTAPPTTATPATMVNSTEPITTTAPPTTATPATMVTSTEPSTTMTPPTTATPATMVASTEPSTTTAPPTTATPATMVTSTEPITTTAPPTTGTPTTMVTPTEPITTTAPPTTGTPTIMVTSTEPITTMAPPTTATPTTMVTSTKPIPTMAPPTTATPTTMVTPTEPITTTAPPTTATPTIMVTPTEPITTMAPPTTGTPTTMVTSTKPIPTMTPPTTEPTDPSTEPTPPHEGVLRFVNDTPFVNGTTVIFAIDSTAGSLSCRLSGVPVPCSVGENTVYDLVVGMRYVLRVTADDFGDEDVELVRRIYVPQTNECSVVLINDGITFDGTMLEMEFSGTGGATEFECRVESSFEPCMSPYMKNITNDDLPKSVRIRPTDCEKNLRQNLVISSITTTAPPTTGTPATMVTSTEVIPTMAPPTTEAIDPSTEPTPPDPERVLRFVNDTPIVDGTTVIFAIDSPASNLSCGIAETPFPCSVGENTVYDLKLGQQFDLKVVAADDFGDEDVELVRSIYVPQTNECSVVLINDGITFDGAMLEMEFSGTGGATEFKCKVESGFEACMSPYTKTIIKDNLPKSVGIKPTDCEKNVRQNFIISRLTTMVPPTTGTPTTMVTSTEPSTTMPPLTTEPTDPPTEPTPPTPERVLRFVNDTPIVDGTTVIFAINSTASNLSCWLAGTAFPCSVGENAVYDLEVGLRYVLRVTADDFGDDDVELVRRIYVPQINECSVVLINDGITFDGAMLEMEFSGTGGATEFKCKVESGFEACMSPYTKTIIKDNLPNSVGIKPTDCEKNVRQNFIISSFKL